MATVNRCEKCPRVVDFTTPSAFFPLSTRGRRKREINTQREENGKSVPIVILTIEVTNSCDDSTNASNFYSKSRRGTRLELICLRGRKKVSGRGGKKKRGTKNRVAASPTLTGIKNQGCPVSKVTRQISNVVSPPKERVESRRNLRTLGDNFNSPLPLPSRLFLCLSPPRGHRRRRRRRQTASSLCRAARVRLRFLKLLARFFDFNYSFNIF